MNLRRIMVSLKGRLAARYCRRLSIGALLVLLAVAAVCFARIRSEQASTARQERAIEGLSQFSRLEGFLWLQSSGLRSHWDRQEILQAEEEGLLRPQAHWEGVTLPAWVRSLVGVHFLCNVVGVDASYSNIDDEGLRFCRELPHLRTLDLYKTSISDSGLEHLETCTRLEILSLGRTRVTGSGLRHLVACEHLEVLGLDYTSVEDSGARYLARCTSLKHLGLEKTAITDGALRHLKGCHNLEVLQLDHTAVTDNGLRWLTDLDGLRTLTLAGTAVTDSGVVHLKQLSGLTGLSVAGTRITRDGLNELAEYCTGLTHVVNSSGQRIEVGDRP